MPRTGITAYDLLISCPGDVIEEIKIIKNVVQDFNRMFGAINNIEISLKHWSTDSYPQMGDKPQEVLNKQFIRECDAAVAVFWTRFGTPTDKYQSGSEEEIEELIKMGKQVFLYFLDKPINPSTVDMSQYEKVRQFMESCKSKGLYAVVGSEEELKKQLLNHLSLYFLNLITGKADEPLPKEKPCLQLRNVNDMSTEFLTVNSFSLIDSAFMKNKEIEINNLYKSAQNLSLPERKPKMIKNETGYENVMKSVTSQFSSLGISQKNLTDADLGNDQKNTIETFFFKKKVLIVPEFWNVGELKKQLVVFRTPFGNNRPSYEGSDNEKQKYDLLVNLYWKIKEFNEYEEYLSILDKKRIVKCVMSNTGTTFDEDIDVKLIIKKNCICHFNDIPIPNMNIIEEINEIKLVDILFKIEESESVEEYSNYLPMHYIDPMLSKISALNSKSAEEEYKENKETYLEKIENVFNYKFFKSNENDTLFFNISYLKQHTNMAFPSVLLFNCVPEYLEYEVRSKRSSDVVKGQIRLGK